MLANVTIDHNLVSHQYSEQQQQHAIITLILPTHKGYSWLYMFSVVNMDIIPLIMSKH